MVFGRGTLLSSMRQVLQGMFGKGSRTFMYILHPPTWNECDTKYSPKANSFSPPKQWWPSCEEESHNIPLLAMTHQCATLDVNVLTFLSSAWFPCVLFKPTQMLLSSYWHKRDCFGAVTLVSLTLSLPSRLPLQLPLLLPSPLPLPLIYDLHTF